MAGIVYVYEASDDSQGAGPIEVQRLVSVHCLVHQCSGNEFGAALTVASSSPTVSQLRTCLLEFDGL